MVRPTFRAGPAAQTSEKTSRESHRQFASARAMIVEIEGQALCRPERRKLLSRQGHADHPDRHAPHQRRRKDPAALQDHRAGRARHGRGTRISVPLPGRRRLPLHEHGKLRAVHDAGRRHRRSGRLPASRDEGDAERARGHPDLRSSCRRRSCWRSPTPSRPPRGRPPRHPTSRRRLSNGVRTNVPPFIAIGTRIVVMTADGSYVERAKE